MGGMMSHVYSMCVVSEHAFVTFYSKTIKHLTNVATGQEKRDTYSSSSLLIPSQSFIWLCLVPC